MAAHLKHRQLKPSRKCGSVQHRAKTLCNNGGYEYGYITSESLSDLHSLNLTYEKYDNVFPDWVVSRKVYEFLIERYPRMEFQPLFSKIVVTNERLFTQVKSFLFSRSHLNV